MNECAIDDCYFMLFVVGEIVERHDLDQLRTGRRTNKTNAKKKQAQTGGGSK
jgi:hypothetical protein